jgi:hypothetical protein
MDRTFRRSHRCLALAALIAVAAPALADDIQIKVGSCKSGVALVARDAPLSKVLERLAEAMAFQLDDEGRADRRVTLNLTGHGPELITKLLSPHERFMVAHARDPRCPGQQKVSRLWLFSNGQATTARNDPTPAAPAIRRTPVTEIGTPEQLRANEERSRQLKQAYDAYVNKHGKPPPGEEEEAARP